MKSKKNALDFYFLQEQIHIFEYCLFEKTISISLASFHIMPIFAYAKKHI